MRLPSLNALRAFEAAARHESFIRAADELCVTQGAVSRHVKLLEDELGVRLFRRLTRGVELTIEGRRFQPIVSDAFENISVGARRLASKKRELRIISAPSFSIRWLIPRLEDFRTRYPDIAISVSSATYDWNDYFEGDFDLGFACGFIKPPNGIDTVPLLPELLTPVCAPSLLKDGNPLEGPADLNAFRLVHTTPDRRDWAVWLDAFNIDTVDRLSGEAFPNLDMATKAVIMGEGIAIGDVVLMRNEIETGTLIRPFPNLTRSSERDGIYLYGRSETWEDPRIAAFFTWVQEATKKDRLAIARL